MLNDVIKEINAVIIIINLFLKLKALYRYSSVISGRYAYTKCMDRSIFIIVTISPLNKWWEMNIGDMSVHQMHTRENNMFSSLNFPLNMVRIARVHPTINESNGGII